MKKLLLSSSLAAATLLPVNNARAQGQFTFAGASVMVDNFGILVKASPASAYDYGLYVSSTPNVDVFSTPILTVRGSGLGAGQIGNTQTILSQPPGTAEYFVVAGWSHSAGINSYLDAVQSALQRLDGDNLLVGVSPVGFVTLSGSPAPASGLFGSNNNPGVEVNIPANRLVLGAYPVPEPSTFALAGWGGAAWLVARRWRR